MKKDQKIVRKQLKDRSQPNMASEELQYSNYYDNSAKL